MPYLQILAIIVFAIFFYRAAELESENETGWIWWVLSVLISSLTIFWLHWGWLGIISGQIALFVGITLFRIWRNPDGL
jgi:hypothetical protein